MVKKKRGKGSSAAAAAAQWKLGDLVLAKVKGFPAWPARVSRAEYFGRQYNPAKVFVVFYGTQQIRFCHHTEISAFTLEARAALHARTLSKCVPLDLKRAVKEICEAADAEIRDNEAVHDEEQTSSNQSYAASDETFTPSLESRRGNGLHISRKRVVKIQVEDAGTTLDESHPGQSSCTNSCSSILEQRAERGVPLVEKVLTNFASHEEQYTFGKESVVEQHKHEPIRFSWVRQCSRTFRRRPISFTSINFASEICQKRKRQVGMERKAASSDTEERDLSNAEGFGDSVDKKAEYSKVAPVKKQRTNLCFRHVKQEKGDATESDKHLPLLKRASARIMHEANCKNEADGGIISNGQENQLPLKAEKYRLRSSGEAPQTMTASSPDGAHDCKTVNVKAKLTKQLEKKLVKEDSCLQSTKLAEVAKARKLKNLTQSSKEVPRLECFRRLVKHDELFVEKDFELPTLHSTSRLYCEDGNRVREAYEAAKEKKQRLAASAPSTSMKYLFAVRSKPTVSLFSRSSDPHREAASSAETEAAQDALEGLLDNLTRAKDSIGRVTRQAVDCARLGASDQVIDIIARRLELEKSFHRRIDLFLTIDSIAQWSHNHRGTSAGVYSCLVQNALPRLLTAAAPPGSFARENRRQCLKVLQQWQERSIFPESVVKHFIKEIEFHDAEKPSSQRAGRTERPLNDPIREMDGMQVDEYGSNAGFSLPGLGMPRLSEEEDSNGGRSMTYMEGAVVPVLEPETHKQPCVLEQVDVELEMEDVSPVAQTNWYDITQAQQQQQQVLYIQAQPPLPVSPPPSTPPPPPPSSPPPMFDRCYYRFGCAT